ncbi:MAG TPA: hypothetical protein VGG20_13985 [Thermoanaerobaculia bacterium]|jgi:hypothetical protein
MQLTRLTAGTVLLLALTAGGGHSARRPAAPLRTLVVHGHRLALGLPPAAGDGDEGGAGDSRRERLARWIADRHRAAPGYDWHAIEAANLQAALARVAAMNLAISEGKAAAAKPVWHERGPVNMTGATALVALAPDNRTLLVATSQGGIFSGTPGGRSWKGMTDSLNGYVHGFLVSPKPETWVAAVTSYNDSRVYVSRNRGATWSASKGLPPLLGVFEMIQEGLDKRTIYLTAFAQDGFSPIVARSRDGGLSFSVVWTGVGLDQPGIWTSRIAAGPLYLLSHGQLLISTDHGSSFTPVGQIDGPPLDFAVLRGSEAGAPTLYAAVGSQFMADSLYASDDGGVHWEKRFTLTGTNYYAFDDLYAGSLSASIRDPQLVLFGNVDGFRSTDGGRTFDRINVWGEYYGSPSDKLHADINGIQFLLYNGREVALLSTDGGTYLSSDGGASVQNITQLGLPSGQFYSTWSSFSNPDLFLAGSQDQGLQLSVPAHGRAGAALSNVQLISGDYAGLTAAAHDLANVFALYPTSTAAAGFVALIDGNDGSLVSAPLPPFTQVGFFATSAADPDDPETVYIAADHIWKVQHQQGDDFTQSELPQSFLAGDNDLVSALAIAPSDHAVWYATTNRGRLWYSRDHGATWTESDTTRAQAPTGSNSALAVAPDDPFTCYAGGSGYGNPPLWVTHDGGVTWTGLDRGLPSTTVWALAFDGLAGKSLYAATEAGPYVLDASSTWRSLLGGGAPVGRYLSVEGIPSAKLVRFGTWSRGIWDYVVPRR